MAKKPQHSELIIDAALALAGEVGWQRVSLATVAQRAKLPLVEVVHQFRSKQAIVNGFVDRIDEHMISGSFEPEASTKDRLFDVLMRRFDAMAQHKDGVRALLRNAAGGDPVAWVCGAKRFSRSMALALEAAGLSSSGLIGRVRIQGLAAVTLYALRAWMEDDSPDMAQTMKALDTALRRADMLAATFTRAPSAAAHPPPPAAEPPPVPTA